ncbi:MAG: site-2 protease family protein [Anaerolineales bacterium]
MGNNISIGKLFGINIKLNWSWFFILVLLTWNLFNAFGAMHPDWGQTSRLVISLLAALLFFLSVLVHELAHSLMARARGISVQGITLFLFGGVSNIQRQPDTPLSEFLITIVGPISSLILGFLFLGLSGVNILREGIQMSNADEIMSSMTPFTTVLMWLGSTNIILGVFNMIPGFPLDGGRVLRSLLWVITDNLKKATRWSSWVGQGIGWVMMISGISAVFGGQIPFFGSGAVNGLWLAFIGWFLNSAAVQSYREVVVQDVLEGVTVGDIMRVSPPTVSGDLLVSDLVHQHIMQKDDHAFPVMEGEALVGLVTLTDVRGVSRSDWERTTVKEIMIPQSELVTVGVKDEAAEAFSKISQLGVRQLPVVEKGSLKGVLRRSELMKWLQLHSDAGPRLMIGPSISRKK